MKSLKASPRQTITEKLRELRFGGSKDAFAMTAIMICVLMLSPLFIQIPAVWSIGAVIALTLVGASWLGLRMAKVWLKTPYLSTGLGKNIVSGQLPTEAKDKPIQDPNELLLGYTVDSGKPVSIPYEDLLRHAILIGQTGVGKTVAGNLMLTQQIERGGGVVFVDGKLNMDDLMAVYRMASYYGRESDVLVVNPGDPRFSNTYNPILFGDPDEVAARILSLIPSTMDSAGADYYKQAANQGVMVIVAAIQRLGLAYNFMDLSILLMNPKALIDLEARMPECDEKTNLSLFLDQFRGPKGNIEMQKVKEIFGGIGGRLFTFGSGNFGDITSSYNPEVKLTEALLKNKIIYVMLPTMGKDIAAGNFGQMLVSDLRSSIAELQDLPEDEKPWPPTMVFMDEAGSYVSPSWSRMFEQARSAHVALLPAMQTVANLKAVDEELAEMVIGNTWTKIFFKVGAQATAEECADLIGKEFNVLRSIATTDSTSSRSSAMTIDPESGQGSTYGVNYSESEQELYRVSPDDLKALDKGEAIVLFGGSELYNIRIPLLSLEESYTKHIPELRINRPKNARTVQGISLYENSEQYLNNYKNQNVPVSTL